MRMVGFRSGNGLSSKNSPISKSKRFSSEELSSRGISNRWNHLERLDLLQSDDLNGQHEELHSRSVSYMEESSSVIGSNEHLDQNNDQTNNFSSVDSCTNCDDTISISSSSRARRKGSVKISKLLNGRRESTDFTRKAANEFYVNNLLELSNVGRVPSKAKPTLNQGKGSVKLVVVGDSKSHSKLSTPKSNLTTTNTDESRKNIRFKYGDLATMISSSFIIPTANSLSYKSASVLDSSSINFASHQKLFTAVTVQEYHLFANILDNVPLISINDALESLENKIRSCGSSLEMLLSVDITITDDESPVVNVNESSDSSTANREKINIKFRLRRNYYILIYLNVHNYLSISVLNSLIDKNDEALGYVQHALQYILPILGKKNLVIATIYCHLGCCFLQFNNDESNKKAITSFKKLLDVLNTLYSDSVHETRTRRRTTLTDKELFKAKPTSSNGNNLSLYGKKSSNSINGSIDVSIDEEDNMQTSGDIHVSDFCKIDKNKKFQEINVDTSGMYYIAALAFLKFEFVKEALQCFKMALLIQQEIYGKNHFVTITTCSHIGQIFYRLQMFHEAMMIYDAILSAVKENYRTSFGINTDGCCTIVDHSNAVNEVNTPYPVKEHVLPLFPLPLFPICLKEYCIEPNPFSNPLKIFPINQKTNRKKFSDDNNITISNESGKVGSKDQNRIASMSTIASSFSGGADVNLLELLLQSYSNAATVYGVLDDFRTASDLYKEAFHLARSKLGESHDYTNDLNALYMRANECLEFTEQSKSTATLSVKSKTLPPKEKRCVIC